MSKVLVATEKPFSKEAVKSIKEVIEAVKMEVVLLEKYTEKSELLKAIADVDAVIIRSDIIDAEVLNAANKLKIVVRAGAGYDNVDLAAASAKNVVVMNTPGQNSNAVAELVFGMLVYMNRNGFVGTAGTELKDKTIGIHAYGYVGRYVAGIAKGFGMKVYAFDPFVDKSMIEKDGVTSVSSVEELYSKCQFVSLHIPANDQTKQSINFDLLNKMPEGATLVNTARKEVIHEDSLIKMFNERPDFRYVSDIEPGNADEIATSFKGRFFFTPKKMGAQTAEANLNAGVAAALQIIGFIQNGDTTFKVN
jgi:D-3-phosphoglycerate dehydrogenase / 2-oxoglutarate reductase